MTDLRTSLGPIRHLSRHSRWCAALLALAVLLAAVTSSAQPPTGQPYTFTVLEASPTGCCTSPKAINNVGGVIGDYHVDPDGPSHSFIWNVDFYGLFDLPFGASGGISGVNDSGDVVGSFSENGGPTTGFLYSDNTFVTITVPGATATFVTDINNRGQIVGAYLGSDDVVHGFLRATDGSFVLFDVPDSLHTSANGINDAGLIVGEHSGPVFVGNRGFVRNVDGSFMAFDAPFSATSTVLHGVNNLGQVVGSYATHGLDTPVHGFVGDVNGSFTSIDPPRSVRTILRGINDSGDLTGEYLDGETGVMYGFVATLSVRSLVSALIGDVVALNLKAGISNSFAAKLGAALAVIDDQKEQNDGAALNAMYAFINAVQAQRGKGLTDVQADSLMSSAQTAIALLDR